MSLKKRMFRSNMKILFTALLSLLLVIVFVLILFEDSLESQVYAISQTRLEGHAVEVAGLMDGGDAQTAEKLQEELARKAKKWDYQIAVIRDGQIISGNQGDEMQDLAQSLGEGESGSRIESGGQGARSGQAELYSYQKATVVEKYIPDENVSLVAAHFPEENWLVSSLNRSFYLFLAAVVAAGIAAIGFLLFLASLFTRRMNRVIMEPVELLVEGAERIRDGRLEEKIHYRGEAEFEHVCETFNDMQATILEDREQRQKTERARIDMVTGISHDLRTPLTSIQGYIKGVLDGIADTEEKKRTYLQTAYTSTEEMNSLLQKLFDFSRMESGQMPFHMVKVDLGEYVTAYAAQKEAAADPDALQIFLDKEKECMTEISVDVEQLRRILDNLLENSVKYAGVCPVCVKIGVEETKKTMVLTWEDNGQGVAQEKLPYIFNRFYRCDESRTKKGSGVGLYVVKYIMERHGGIVSAENAPGLKVSLHFPKTRP